MFSTLLRAIAWLPLRVNHWLGAALGLTVYWCAASYRRCLRENLLASGIARDGAEARALIYRAARETGKSVLELPAFWFAGRHRVISWMQCDEWTVVERARARGKGVIIITPHLGGFEISAFYIVRRTPFTLMFRPPHLQWLESAMQAGRQRFGASVVPASLRGVRSFLQVLRDGGAVGLLPDQTPSTGDGTWAPFFGRPAYTMTLIRRLQTATGAALVMVYTERLPGGGGFRIRFEEVPTADFDEAALNRAVEAVVRRIPAQYLWGYNRYKQPPAAPPPPSPTAEDGTP